MSRGSNFEAWRAALPLVDAWEHFASPNDKANLASAPNFNSSLSGGLAQAAASTAPVLLNLLKPLMAANAAEQARNDIIEGMRESLLDALFNNQLIAFGYRKRPSRSTYPIKIDPDFFDGVDIHWNNSSAENFRLLYVDIRISQNIIPSSASSTSRKGSLDAINTVIMELIIEYSDFCDLPRKKACELIRQKLNRIHVKGDGLSDQHLSKLIFKICPGRAIQF